MPRIQSRVTFEARGPEAASILDSLGRASETKKDIGISSVTLFLDQPEYALLTDELDRRGIEYTELKELSFTPEELANAELLMMRPSGYWGYPQPEDGFREASFSTLSGCSVCGAGIRQTKPLRVKPPIRLGSNDILAMNWVFEFVVTERFKRLVEDGDLDGAEFWPLLNHRTGEPVSGFYQLYFLNEMPPSSPETQFERTVADPQPPPECHHPILNLTVNQLRYRRSDLNGAKDFNKTHECLGGGWFNLNQWKVVNHRVYNLFTLNKIRRVRFEPILIED